MVKIILSYLKESNFFFFNITNFTLTATVCNFGFYSMQHSNSKLNAIKFALLLVKYNFVYVFDADGKREIIDKQSG